MKYYHIILLFSLSFFSCQNKSQDKGKRWVVTRVHIPGYLTPAEQDSARYNVLYHGDLPSYRRLRIYYECVEPHGILNAIGYSWLMAETYNNSQACYDLYTTWETLERYHKKEISPATRQFIIENLKKSAEAGHSGALYELSKLYMEGIHVPKDVKLAKQLEEQSQAGK